MVFLAIDRAYVRWATLFLRSLGRHHKDVRATVQGVNLEVADLIALAGCPGTIAVSNARVDLKGRRLAEYVANRRPIWFREVVRREEARWYLLADADLLVRRPLGGLKALAAGHDAALVFRPGYWKGRVWAKLRVAAGLVLVGRSAGPLLDEWVACLHSDRPIEDVRPWAWFWEQACLYVATTRVPLRYAPIPAKEYLGAYPFTPESAIWSANVRPGLKPVVYERFAGEFKQVRGGLRAYAAPPRLRGRGRKGPPGISS